MSSRKRRGTGSDRISKSEHVDVAAPPPLRLAVALGDPERERTLLSSLGLIGDVVITERCLSADHLLLSIERGNVDAALVTFDLHRLNEARLKDLTRSRLPFVLLVSDVEDAAWQQFPGVVTSLDAAPEAMYAALLAAVRGERPQIQDPGKVDDPQAAETDPASDIPTAELAVIAVASGAGSPGRTTVALNLAAALGAVAPTILVDADVTGPAIAAAIDADPTRNVSMLVHAEPETPQEWDRAISQEVQRLSQHRSQAVTLCGVPKPELRGSISRRFFERLVAQLRQRYRYVILDIGAELLAAEVALHRATLDLADEVLIVASADLIGLWRARVALGQLSVLQIGHDRIALVINRHDHRYHQSRAEIEWALGLRAAAVVPHDYRAMQRALSAQRPLVLDGRSRAGSALLQLAEQIHGDTFALPEEGTDRSTDRWWRRMRRFGRGRRASSTADGEEVPDGSYATRIP